LQAATSNPARVVRRSDLGAIQPGRLADMVLLEADPLADIRNTRRIRAVIAGGRLLDRPALDRLLASAEQAAKEPVDQAPTNLITR
jgi:imidazolonepropionase-like amidohydrolase